MKVGDKIKNMDDEMRDPKYNEFHKKFNNINNSDYHEGLVYLFGRGVPQDFRLAQVCFERATREVHSESEYYLGLLFMIGAGSIEQSINFAISCLENATFHSRGVAENAQLILDIPTTAGKTAKAHELARDFMPPSE